MAMINLAFVAQFTCMTCLLLSQPPPPQAVFADTHYYEPPAVASEIANHVPQQFHLRRSSRLDAQRHVHRHNRRRHFGRKHSSTHFWRFASIANATERRDGRLAEGEAANGPARSGGQSDRQTRSRRSGRGRCQGEKDMSFIIMRIYLRCTIVWFCAWFPLAVPFGHGLFLSHNLCCLSHKPHIQYVHRAAEA